MNQKDRDSVVVSAGFWQQSWHRFRRRKLSMFALYFIGVLSMIAVFSPMIAGTKPIVCRYKGSIYFPCMGYYNRTWENPIFQKDRFRRIYPRNLKRKDPDSWAIWPLVYQDPHRPVRRNEWEGMKGNPYGAKGQPTSKNWFGTYKTGFDVFASMVHGTRIALLVGFVSTGIAATIGITLGAIAGYMGGIVDLVISRVIEVVMCVPALVLILSLQAVIEDVSIWNIMMLLGLTGWTSMARLTRGEFLKLRETEFVAAARCLGASRTRIMFRHVLPNALAPVMVPIAFGIAAGIQVEAALSLLGFGAPPPNPSWGTILNSGRETLQSGYWWQLVFPGMGIFLTVLAYNLIGEGIQEATDPRLADPGN
ncbi:MAG: peptide ABC transporter permease [Planctomycetaceae bacterium]|nr:peptide ABC transporter permease [Planctomycetaceae bacterium]|tara:strand:- start:1340 stop:2434 length:1095 start_codon:yes stop_codon:yes gene_type:complete